ncbi:MAG: hypothetical protein ACRD35_02950 [Candidatus Acidiferrales bacterium]
MKARLEERLARAERGGPEEIRLLVHDSSLDVLLGLLRNPFFSEEHLLTLLQRKDAPRELLEAVARHEQWVQSPRVKAAVVEHPRTPRLLALRLLKFLYLFDLVTVTLQPAVSAEIKRLAEDLIINRVAQLPLGQQITLGRRASARVVAALLLEGNEPVIGPALDNSFLTEAALLSILRRDDLAEALVEQIARHPKWSTRYDVRLQLVRHPLTPLGTALAFLPDLKVSDLRIIVTDRRMRASLRDYVKAEIKRRLARD